MLRQIALQVTIENGLQTAATANGVKMNVVDCKTFNRTGMSLLLGLKGEPEKMKATLTSIRSIPGVRQAVEGDGVGSEMPVLVVMDRPPICRASSEAAIVCLECPLNSETQPSTWKFITRKASDFREVLAKLEREGIESRIEEVSPLERRSSLTGRQREIISRAMAEGYFEFPRKVSLTRLSELVGVKPSTLSEILRSAERRIMANALGAAPRDDQN